jgi:HAD superfamily hydrolase (TIGR01484 family)
MINAIILDIDGVIVGEKTGFNSPSPHKEVLRALNLVKSRGIPIALCTAKPYFSITDIIEDAKLNNPHITDAGAVIIDPLDNIVIEKHIIEKNKAEEVLKDCIANNIYVEFYTSDDYFIQQNQTGPITTQHTHILMKAPKPLDAIVEESLKYEITKIIPVALNKEDQARVNTILQKYTSQLSLSWAVHPVALPLQFAILTDKNSSKRKGAESIGHSLGVSFSDVLGVGDSTSDWNFMELCGYAATLENGSAEIKKLITAKGPENSHTGKSVDENGILDILNYFKLL